MNQETIHNPDRYMGDLRQILSQGKKRIGLLVGAGAPVSLRVDDNGKLCDLGKPIIPDVTGLTLHVMDKLDSGDLEIVNALLPDLGKNPNIETILTKIRRLSQAIGNAEILGLNGIGYERLAERICKHIGEKVAPVLPEGTNPYTELVSWIGGINREHPVEIFSPNYDLLMEEAFEQAMLPYFDGFSGSHKPFFDPTSIANDKLPPRWSRLWKIHGSLGWNVSGNTVIRTGKRNATSLIFPDHLKYDQITRQPYSSLFERLKEFLMTPDSILICTGFSFFDAHITAVLDEALEANKHTSIIAFQYKNLVEEQYAFELAKKRPNLSVYAKDRAVIFGIEGKWQPGQPPSEEWLQIRQTFWEGENSANFLLGDFAKMARFFALSQASDFILAKEQEVKENNAEDISANNDSNSPDKVQNNA
ncbi:SIR2 family protein [Alteromonas stellipolaris]|uniref:SIR2 family protein n=1 Tax=Alteromonas stellipolaris TaxID=233316 RepID=UPI00249489C0|nr:SIR2 family protein [Alteromonas stellipolaris]